MSNSLTPGGKPVLAVTNGKITTTSTAIAKHFGKRHGNVLRAIERLDCSPEFSQLNFESAEYTDEQGKTRKAFNITRDGFVFLCMGFTGAEAAAWKEKYIAAFNAMAEKLECRIPIPQTGGIDAAKLLLEGQSAPTVPLPGEIQSLINKRAWTLAHDAYELLRAHLARRIAYTCEMGNPRQLDTEGAKAVIAACDLGGALAHVYVSKLQAVAVTADAVASFAAELSAEMDGVLGPRRARLPGSRGRK